MTTGLRLSLERVISPPSSNGRVKSGGLSPAWKIDLKSSKAPLLGLKISYLCSLP